MPEIGRTGRVMLDLEIVQIRVVEWPRARTWYVHTLGLPVLRDDPEREYCLLGTGRVGIALKGGSTAGGDRLSVDLIFRVDDLDAVRNRLIGLGVEVSPIRHDAAERYHEAKLRDPEGTPIILFAWREPLLPSANLGDR